MNVTSRLLKVAPWGVALGLAAASCRSDFEVNRDEFCGQNPSHPECGGAGGAGGGGSSGTAGAPAMGSGGTSGTGGTSGGGSSSSAGNAGRAGNAGSGGSAGGPSCDAPEVACGSSCFDVTSSAENCGACGYACGGSLACGQGACAPQTVVSNVVAPFAFVLDATSLYFGSALANAADVVQPAVRKVAREGNSAVSVLFAGVSFRSRTLVLADGILFFGDLDNGGVLRKGPAAGGDDATHVTGQPAVQHLVAAESRLWWASFDGGTSALRRAPVAASTPVESLAFQTGRVDSLAVEGTGSGLVVYWVNRDTSPGAKGGLWRRAEGVADVNLVPGGQMRQLALGADGVYVADALTGIGKTAKAVAQAALSPVISPGNVGGSLQGLALANGQLYWLAISAAGQIEVHRSNLDGGEARVLGRIAAKQPPYWEAPIGPSQLVVDGGFVYFVDPGSITGDTQAGPNLQGVTGAPDGAIYRLPQ